jgi:hypothetical protein
MERNSNGDGEEHKPDDLCRVSAAAADRSLSETSGVLASIERLFTLPLRSACRVEQINRKL